MEAMISEGYLKRGIPLTQIARWLSANPALRFGLYPHKGVISKGSDADLVCVDLNRQRRIDRDELLSKHKHSIYEGYTLGCTTQTITNRGRIVYQRNEGIKGKPLGILQTAE